MVWGSNPSRRRVFFPPLFSSSLGNGVLSQEVKWPGQEANHSPLINVEVKIGWTSPFSLRIPLWSVQNKLFLYITKSFITMKNERLSMGRFVHCTVRHVNYTHHQGILVQKYTNVITSLCVRVIVHRYFSFLICRL
jgi:hypothetical protein